jgi:hypothetical protein
MSLNHRDIDSPDGRSLPAAVNAAAGHGAQGKPLRKYRRCREREKTI